MFHSKTANFASTIAFAQAVLSPFSPTGRARTCSWQERLICGGERRILTIQVAWLLLLNLKSVFNLLFLIVVGFFSRVDKFGRGASFENGHVS